MNMKKTDLVKGLAKKLEGRMKSTGVPVRFGQGSAAVAKKAEPRPAVLATKLIPVACRLPAELVNRLRERAMVQEGGVNTVIAQALAHWLDTAAGDQSHPAT